MQIQPILDFDRVLAGRAGPVHLVLHFQAPELPAGNNRQGLALGLVIDTSGSMAGSPIQAAHAAALEVVRHLRREDQLAIVGFSSEAHPILPLQAVADPASARSALAGMHIGGGTNLCAGWMLGAEALSQAPSSHRRRLLLLSDGQLNTGVVEPTLVRQAVVNGLERQGLRTSCLGFGPDYDADLLRELASSTGGAFHDANDAESFPTIFAAELEGLQQIAVQNLRLRCRPGPFCEGISPLGEARSLRLPDGRLELSLGDLVSGESRHFVLALDLLSIPRLADGTAAATLEGEPVLDAEVVYDLCGPDGIAPRVWSHTVRVLPVQDAAECRPAAEALRWVHTQTSGRAVDRALRAAKDGDTEGAKAILRQQLEWLKATGGNAAGDTGRLLQHYLDQLENESFGPRSMRCAAYTSTFLSRCASSQVWTGPENITPLFSANLSSWRRTHDKKSSEGRTPAG